MDLTPREIIAKEIGIRVGSSDLTPMDVGECVRCMLSYAEQEAKSYASWLSNQVISGRTSTKLWNDYQSEFNNPTPHDQK